MRATKSISAEVQSAVSELLAELQAKSGCEKYGVTPEAFAEILGVVATKYLPNGSQQGKPASFLLTLRVEELALARACAAGHNTAWEIFLTRYREKLYQSALRIAREDSAARELADNLYAELYGMNTRDDERVSKLASFTGRGSLEGWLRTVLAQEFVNRYRRTETPGEPGRRRGRRGAVRRTRAGADRSRRFAAGIGLPTRLLRVFPAKSA